MGRRNPLMLVIHADQFWPGTSGSRNEIGDKGLDTELRHYPNR